LFGISSGALLNGAYDVWWCIGGAAARAGPAGAPAAAAAAAASA